MKKLIASTLIVLGFAAAAAIMPDYEIKIVEKQAAACNAPDCSGG